MHLIPDGHPEKPSYLNNLGKSLLTRFKEYNNLSDLYAAASDYHSAAKSDTGSLNTRFEAARSWMQLALQYLPSQSMESSAMCISLIQQLAWPGSSIHDRYHQLTHAGQVTRDAAAVAIRASQYNTAVEWLEQGRSIIWSQIMQLHSPLDELYQAHPSIGQMLRSLSSALEDAYDNPETPVQANYHMLAYQREQLLKQIHTLPGFESYLLPRSFSQLLAAVNQGPIVMLNVSKLQCDALVLIPGFDDIFHLPLENLTLEAAWAWHQLFQLAMTRNSISINEFPSQLKALKLPDKWEKAIDHEDILAYILENLWAHVVYPILNALAITVSLHFC